MIHGPVHTISNYKLPLLHPTTILTSLYISLEVVFYTIFTTNIKGKYKVLPRTGQGGTEGEQRYSPTLPSSTLVLNGGGWSASRPGSFTPGKDPVPIV